ncbi:unnamed protein product [Eruca vesicaria subsp. sativa]|uniref:indole-3-pyruvate monooxygenase n=1 Tax=Eruca vesicaria subsp. sativa TaxID=29727 RepID=A0ABC8JLM5_ERUVS|nr:unnamed protein product [Eruca vesicaria subsp. sativa]
METVVLIVGAGPAGLATSVCLNQHSIPNVILEKEDIYASLWKKRAYDRLKLHLAKNFCQLPYMPHGPDVPTFMSKDLFIKYLDAYVTHFDINPRYNRTVKFSTFEVSNDKWRVEAENNVTGETEVYWSDFLVVATGENGDGNIPARHVLTKEEVYVGMSLLKYCSVTMVDALVMMMASTRLFMYGDLSKYGLFRPKQGPFATKLFTGKAPVIDVGTIKKILEGEIQVINGGIRSIQGKTLTFENGLKQDFDAIVFATGYKSSVCNWLKNYEYMMKEDGFPKKPMPKHWKGEKNLYCAGFSRKGIAGAAQDAMYVAEDIRSILATTKY